MINKNKLKKAILIFLLNKTSSFIDHRVVACKNEKHCIIGPSDIQNFTFNIEENPLDLPQDVCSLSVDVDAAQVAVK